MEYDNKHDELRDEHSEVFDVLSNWFKFTKFHVQHFWEDTNTFYIVTTNQKLLTTVMSAIRVFRIDGEYHLSVDNSWLSN